MYRETTEDLPIRLVAAEGGFLPSFATALADIFASFGQSESELWDCKIVTSYERKQLEQYQQGPKVKLKLTQVTVKETQNEENIKEEKKEEIDWKSDMTV